jgi:hypothetical protein
MRFFKMQQKKKKKRKNLKEKWNADRGYHLEP